MSTDEEQQLKNKKLIAYLRTTCIPRALNDIIEITTYIHTYIICKYLGLVVAYISSIVNSQLKCI